MYSERQSISVAYAACLISNHLGRDVTLEEAVTICQTEGHELHLTGDLYTSRVYAHKRSNNDDES